jgi:hypothetical protein
MKQAAQLSFVVDSTGRNVLHGTAEALTADPRSRHSIGGSDTVHNALVRN